MGEGAGRTQIGLALTRSHLAASFETSYATENLWSRGVRLLNLENDPTEMSQQLLEQCMSQSLQVVDKQFQMAIAPKLGQQLVAHLSGKMHNVVSSYRSNLTAREFAMKFPVGLRI